MTSYLLDTHVWLWLETNTSEISHTCLTILKNSDSPLAISPISSLELAQLESKNKIRFNTPLSEWISKSMENLKLVTAAFNHDTAVAAYSIELNHKDPADRILAATALKHSRTLVTADSRLLQCKDIKTLNAKI